MGEKCRGVEPNPAVSRFLPDCPTTAVGNVELSLCRSGQVPGTQVGPAHAFPEGWNMEIACANLPMSARYWDTINMPGKMVRYQASRGMR